LLLLWHYGILYAGDIKKIRFYDEATSWEAEGRYRDKDIHECAAIQLVYPEYKPLSDKQLLKQRNVNVQLVTERGVSNTLKFTYIPGKAAPLVFDCKIYFSQLYLAKFISTRMNFGIWR